MKLFLASDLHGSQLVMNKITVVPKFYGVRSVVLAGDLTGKLLVPIIRKDAEFTFNYFGAKRTVNEQKLGEIIEEIRNSGHYYSVVTREEYEDLVANKSKQRQLFLTEIRESLTTFVTKVERGFKVADANMYVIPGNDDFPEVAAYIETLESERFIPFEGRSVALEAGYTMTGYGYTNPTPWHTPREKSEEEIYSDLCALVGKTATEKMLLVTHAPPYGTLIDRAPKLTKDLKPVVTAGMYETISVGSVAVRRIIEERGPMVGLHGHVHESQGVDRISHRGGRTPVFNPGSEYSSGILKGVILLIEGDKVENFLFTRG
jgi:Icc-related predicted phosphoesterase